MSRFHINLQTGEVGKCRAELSCPFGSMETDHYPSKAAARSAYEEKMGSEAPGVFTVLLNRMDQKADIRRGQAFNERQIKEYEKEEAVRAKRNEAREAFVRSMKLPTTLVPPKPEGGHLRTLYGPEVGSASPLGGTVVEVLQPSEHHPEVFVTAKAGDHTYNYRVAASEAEAREEWIDEPDPEALRAYDAAVNERSIEDFYLNHMGLRSRPALFFNPDLSDKDVKLAKRLLANVREFKRLAEEYSKDGKPAPYTRAYEASAPNPNIDHNGSSAFSFLVRGETLPHNPYAYRSSSMSARGVVANLYPKGSFSYPPDRESLLKEREDLLP